MHNTLLLSSKQEADSIPESVELVSVCTSVKTVCVCLTTVALCRCFDSFVPHWHIQLSACSNRLRRKSTTPKSRFMCGLLKRNVKCTFLLVPSPRPSAPGWETSLFSQMPLSILTVLFFLLFTQVCLRVALLPQSSQVYLFMSYLKQLW